jgi:AAA15 family ATPase/GTPase
MISFIDIKNFRCFEHTRAENFKQVNLITGLNNAGKTSFLEAILMLTRFDLFLNNYKIRLKTENDTDAYLNLFYKANVTNKIAIATSDFSVTMLGKIEIVLGGYRNETPNDFGHYFKNRCSLPNLENYYNTNFGIFHRNSEVLPDFYQYFSVAFILDKHNQYPQTLNISDMVDEFDISGKKDILLKAVQLVDNSIKDLRTFNKKGNILYAQQNGIYRPLQYFGDALQKIVLYILSIINAKGDFKILLIDEIENGVHHTVQSQLWAYIFKLAAAYNVQIFATTHSLEMIKAFEKTAEKENFQDKITCIELAKHSKTDEILSNTIDAAQLKYNLYNHLDLRGE